MCGGVNDGREGIRDNSVGPALGVLKIFEDVRKSVGLGVEVPNIDDSGSESSVDSIGDCGGLSLSSLTNQISDPLSES